MSLKEQILYSRDYLDVAAGVALLCVGLFAALYGYSTMRMGTVAQMGPGLFPVSLGIILSGFGMIIAIPAFFRNGPQADFDGRALLFVGLSLLAFSVLVRPFGLLPAIVVLTCIASLSDGKLATWKSAILGLGLSACVLLIFHFGLGLQLRMLAMPW